MLKLVTEPELIKLAPPAKIGLLAGAGSFPITFAKAAQAQGFRVHTYGVDGMASDELLSLSDKMRFGPLAQLGRSIRFFKRHNVEHVVMAGKIEKTVLFDPWRIFKLLPDWRTTQMWFNLATQNKKDDTILLAVIREFEKDGIRFGSALDYCPEILVSHGFLTQRKPTSAQWKDIAFGWELAKEMGRLDVGQTVVVNDQAAIAIEAIEGTDKAIRRAGELCRRGGFTVVKVAKPQQDMRFDVPTIGLNTIHTIHEAGGKVLAVEAAKTILLDEPEVLKLADRLGITIVALHADEIQLKIAA
jgi:DUF1009 family protein